MNIYFRVDASNLIGTGHVIRCLTLAELLKTKSASCVFICREHEGNLISLIESCGFQVERTPSKSLERVQSKHHSDFDLAHAEWLGSDWETDAEETKELIGEAKVDWLIVDHYALDCRWESALKPHCSRLMVIDDLADRKHDCDILLDQNLVANSDVRYDQLVPKHCIKLLGTEYALLQTQYAELHPRTPPRTGPVRRILIYFGGSDKTNITGKAVSAFLSLGRSDIEVDVVINKKSLHAEEVCKQVSGHRNITVHDCLPSLAYLMIRADFAIGAGGATSWERCCLGLPALIVTMAKNQEPIAAELDRMKLAKWLGRVDEIDEGVLEKALKEFHDEGLEAGYSERCLRVLDGNGTNRLVALLSVSSESSIRADLACLHDESTILRIIKDSIVTEDQSSAETFDAEKVRGWFRSRIRDQEGCRIYFIKTEEGCPLGYVCLENISGKWRISSRFSNVVEPLLKEKILVSAILKFRQTLIGALVFDQDAQNFPFRYDGFEACNSQHDKKGVLSISFCSDSDSWINRSIAWILLKWIARGHSCTWAHSASVLPGGDLCFYLSYGRIVGSGIREKYRNNLVIHASNLPKGRGWSPISWLILDGQHQFTVTLFEALNDVDAGPIYAQRNFELRNTELIDEWRNELAEVIMKLAGEFVARYPDSVGASRPQEGESTYYEKRGPKDSELNIDKTLQEQFNLLRIVDNERYPAFFSYKGKEFILKISEKTKTLQ